MKQAKKAIGGLHAGNLLINKLYWLHIHWLHLHVWPITLFYFWFCQPYVCWKPLWDCISWFHKIFYFNLVYCLSKLGALTNKIFVKNQRLRTSNLELYLLFFARGVHNFSEIFYCLTNKEAIFRKWTVKFKISFQSLSKNLIILQLIIQLWNSAWGALASNHW